MAVTDRRANGGNNLLLTPVLKLQSLKSQVACIKVQFALDLKCVVSNTAEMKFNQFLVRSCLIAFGLSLSTASSNAQTPPPAAPATPATTAPALDFGDSKSSTLTTKAWQALDAKNYAEVIGYANKCIDLYKTQAVQMQGTLKAAADKDSANQYWALNDVGTCYFILGKALDDQGDKKGATAAYKSLVDTLSFAQCWDPKGWFWAPADAARKRLAELQFDAAQ